MWYTCDNTPRKWSADHAKFLINCQIISCLQDLAGCILWWYRLGMSSSVYPVFTCELFIYLAHLQQEESEDEHENGIQLENLATKHRHIHKHQPMKVIHICTKLELLRQFMINLHLFKRKESRKRNCISFIAFIYFLTDLY